MTPSLALAALLALALAGSSRAEDAPPPIDQEPPAPLEEIALQALSLRTLVATAPAGEFLRAVGCLEPPPAMPRTVWYRRETRQALSPEEAAARTPAELEGFQEEQLDERFYWLTRYGTPVAFVRPLELLGRAGMETLTGTRLLDFGFGSVGQLRVLASLGADVTGIEVDALLERLYAHPQDTGPVTRCDAGPGAQDGHVRLLFGQFPAEEPIVRDAGAGYDAFLSKNTLKRGYIHPEQEVDPRMLVHLGVDDATFVAAVHTLLKPGGLFLIYNLCPAPSPEKYIPWADGRCPFDRALLETTGFDLISFDEDDTEAAREMGQALGWAESMDLETDLFGTYTLARKR
ncbi:MAG TPA: hypothetical protein VKU85_18270 [bacterium]|nr:hypothetical protein [bacterium]